MLIYEKFVEEDSILVRHLYVAANGIPSEADAKLEYVDADGDSFEPTENDIYLDDGKGGIIRKSDDRFVAVKANGEYIIPNKNWQPQEKVIKSIKITKKPTKLIYTVGEYLDLTGMKVQAIYESGDKEQVTEYTTSPDTETELTKDTEEVIVTFSDKTAKFTITVQEATDEESEKDLLENILEEESASV